MWFMLISGCVNTPFPFINAMYVFSFKPALFIDVTSFCSESDCFLSRPLVNVSLVNTEWSSPAWGYVFSEFVRRPLRQSCVFKYQCELIHSPKLSSKSSSSSGHDCITLKAFLAWAWPVRAKPEPASWSQQILFLIIMSHGNHSEKLNKRSVSSCILVRGR